MEFVAETLYSQLGCYPKTAAQFLLHSASLCKVHQGKTLSRQAVEESPVSKNIKASTVRAIVTAPAFHPCGRITIGLVAIHLGPGSVGVFDVVVVCIDKLKAWTMSVPAIG